MRGGLLTGVQTLALPICVGLVRALMLDPPVLLLDEPLGALDPVIRHELQAQMRELFATLGKTVVLVTHAVAEAAWLAATLVLRRAGRIVQQGSARELAETPADPSVAPFLTEQRRRADARRGRGGEGRRYGQECVRPFRLRLSSDN